MVASWWRKVVGLSLPLACAGCGRWETHLCPQCRQILAGPPFPVEHAQAASDLEILAVAPYAGPIRALVLGWKNGAREDLNQAMADVGQNLGCSWAATHDARQEIRATTAGTSAQPDQPWPPPALLVVPAPSGWRRRLRGRLVAARLADAVAQGIAAQWAQQTQQTQDRATTEPSDQPHVVLSADVLRRRGWTRAHQAGSSAQQRRTNREVPPRVLAPVSGLAVVLVDDVVTTGATLGACARALRQEGAQVVGALTLACTPPPARPGIRINTGSSRHAATCPPPAISSITKQA